MKSRMTFRENTLETEIQRLETVKETLEKLEEPRQCRSKFDFVQVFAVYPPISVSST